jgi:hypothetical protein
MLGAVAGMIPGVGLTLFPTRLGTGAAVDVR